MVDSSYISVGTKIREQRSSLGMTQEVLAERVGLSRASIANIERGRQAVFVHQLVKLGAALGVPAEVLLPQQEDVGANVASASDTLPDDIRQLVQRLNSAGRDR